MNVEKLVKPIFFGNIFYGICVVALAIEASLQQQKPLNNCAFYLFLFSGTVVYYTKAYISETIAQHNNLRAVWYARYHQQIVFWHSLLVAITIISAVFLAIDIWIKIPVIPFRNWFFMFVFPSVAILYYGISSPQKNNRFTLRDIGWLKPFIIGFVWAGLANVYPVLYNCTKSGIPYSMELFGTLLFIKNCMFITLLCIMFDIKDYATDYNQQLKTFVVHVGLRKTIFYIIIPLSSLGLGTFLTYALLHHFPALRIAINTVPFLLLIKVAYSLHQRKSILYYLAVIDGLMLAKAACGIIGVTLVK